MTRHEMALLVGAPGGIVAEPGAGPTVVAESDPQKFMATFSEAVAKGGEIFLSDPSWGENEKAQLNAQLPAAGVQRSTQPGRGWLMIPTGGTSGTLKFARHDEETLSAAVRAFTKHFGLARVNA